MALFGSSSRIKDEASAKFDLQQMIDSTKYTPDNHRLDKYASQFLFCHDDFKKGEKNHEAIEDRIIKRKGLAFTDDKFTFVDKRERNMINGVEPAFPVAIPDPNGSRIGGIVYEVPNSVIRDLDTHRENGVKFHRARVRLTVPFRQVLWVKDPSLVKHETVWTDNEKQGVVTTRDNTLQTKAWMYIGDEGWKEELDNGFHFKEVNKYKPNSGWSEPYYYYKDDNIK